MSTGTAPVDAFLEAPTASDRAEAFVALVRDLRLSSAATEGRRKPLSLFLDELDAAPGRREGFARAVSQLLVETDGTSLFGDAGIPSERGFLAELGDRLSDRLVPKPRDDRDLATLLHRLFRNEEAVELVERTALSDIHRLVRLLAEQADPAALERLRGALGDGFRLLLARIQAQGLSRKLRARSTPGPVSGSPFHRVVRSGDGLLEAWRTGSGVEAALAAFRRDSGDCRKEVRVITRHLEDAGVSVDIVFGLEVIDRCLTRAALTADVMAAPAGPEQSRAILRLLARLARYVPQDRSVVHLVRWNLQMLDRKIVDRSGQTGEHYVAATRREYGHIWLAAAAGGLLTVLTAAFKMKVHEWHLAPFPESFLYGLNYAVSFLLLQTFGLILATKQPAMTAAALASIMRDAQGDDREERIAAFFARLTSSQLAAAVSNVLSVGIGCSLFVLLFQLAAGRPYLTERVARETFATLSPVNSGTVFYAALTGVLLWLGSLAGGWFENWATYHRIPEGLAGHRLGRLVGGERMTRFAEAFARNASGWGTNVALGFLLGFAPAVGRFFGIPFDVRHVTLSTGTLALAAASLGEKWYGGGFFLLAVAGIGTMFVLNLSVSFSLSLLNAAQAYGMTLAELTGVLKQVFARVLKSPLEFVRPPRAEVPASEPAA